MCCAARHADASESAPHRTVTAMLYLNPDWQQGFGGELCLYNHSQGEQVADQVLKFCCKRSGMSSKQISTPPAEGLTPQ